MDTILEALFHPNPHELPARIAPYPTAPKYQKITSPKYLLECIEARPECVFYGYWKLYNPKTETDDIYPQKPEAIDNPNYDWDTDNEDTACEPRRFYPNFMLCGIIESGTIVSISDKLENEFFERIFQPGEVIYCKSEDDCKRIEKIINRLKGTRDLYVRVNSNIIAIEVEPF